MKKRGLSISVYLSNRWLYSLIILTLILIVSVGVYAVIPNPGHSDGGLESLSASKIVGTLSTSQISDGAITNEKINSVNWNKLTNIPNDQVGVSECRTIFQITGSYSSSHTEGWSAYSSGGDSRCSDWVGIKYSGYPGVSYRTCIQCR